MGLREILEKRKREKEISQSDWAYKQRAEKLREDRRRLESRLEYYREKEKVDRMRKEYAAKHGMVGKVVRGIRKGQGILSKIPASNYDPYAGMRQATPAKKTRSRKTKAKERSIWDF